MKRHTPPFRMKELKIEVTYRCELNCIHCSSDAHSSNSMEMAFQDCQRILAQASQMGAKNVAFSGGEPLLWPYIFEAVESACHHQLAVTLYTSGNVPDFKKKTAPIHHLGAKRFIFSIFGANPSAHERITRKAGSFNRTIKSLREASAIGLTVEIHFVPMSNNYRELREVARLARDAGASRISVLRLVPQGRAALVRGRALSRVQNLELRHEIQLLRSEYGCDFVRTGSPYNFLIISETPGCWAAIDRVIIGPDLRLYPCDAFKRIGAEELVKTERLSTLDSASLDECWKGSPYLEAVRKYLTSDFETPCNSCELLEKCVSGCLAQKAIAYNSLNKKPDPDCLGSEISAI